MQVTSNRRHLGLIYFSIILIVASSQVISSAYFLQEKEEQENETLQPEKWQDWARGRTAEGIHADSIEKVIVLLVQTKDVAPDDVHSVNYFDELLFGDNFGSMSHFYSENSRGQTKVQGEVVGWLKLSNDLSDYDEDLWLGEEYGVGDGIEEAISMADVSVDFSIYDQNGDGIIDNLMVVFVGENDAANGDGDGDGYDSDGNAIWPVQWELQSPHETDDGVTASRFFVCSEYCDIGTFAHEFGHNLGLPDLYDGDYSSEGVGVWSLMSGGNYLEWNNQPNPAHFGAWSKYKLGWVSPTVVSTESITQQIILNPVETDGKIIKVPISNSEYWLIEYRSINAGEYDRGLPSSGVLIWHIDEGVTDEYGDFDNTDEEHPAVKLIQADGYDDLKNGLNDGDAGDPFGINSVFNNRSSPSALTWSGSDVGLSMSISGIDEVNDVATISMAGENSPQAWFYNISWGWDDSEGDGFLNQVTFTYDIDGYSSNFDVRVEFQVYDAETHEYRGSFNSTHTINGEDVDDFEYPIGWYSEAMDLIEFKVLLWVGDELLDSYFPEHPIWIEYPSESNEYDEWFESFELFFSDEDGDGNYETILAEYRISSDNPDSPLVEVWLECFNRNDVETSSIVIQEGLQTNNGSKGFVDMDLSSTDIRPGFIDIWAWIWVGDELEEVFAWQETEFWWDALYIEEDTVSSVDIDGDGNDDALALKFRFDHTWKHNELIDLEFMMWNISDVSDTNAVPLDQVNYSLIIGPRNHSSSGGRDLIGITLSSESESVSTIELRIIYPDDSEESVWYSKVDGYVLSGFDSLNEKENNEEISSGNEQGSTSWGVVIVLITISICVLGIIVLYRKKDDILRIRDSIIAESSISDSSTHQTAIFKQYLPDGSLGYHEGLIAEGYTLEEATNYTVQHFPDFQFQESRLYYEGLIAEGYTPEEASNYTVQYFPDFQLQESLTYYEGLIAEGYTPEEATNYTKQYYPIFEK